MMVILARIRTEAAMSLFLCSQCGFSKTCLASASLGAPEGQKQDVGGVPKVLQIAVCRWGLRLPSAKKGLFFDDSPGNER